MLRVYLLGPFRVERDGRPIPPQKWARPKDRTVFKLLALERGHVVPRDRLLDLLWPNLAPAAAANNLHVAVSRLRKLLSPSLHGNAAAPWPIRREAAGYTLSTDSSVWTDLEEFRRQLGHGREWRRRGAWATAARAYRAAEALYRGDLLEEDPYEEWAIHPREHLRETHLALREELADCLVRLDMPDEAAEVCERGLSDDRTREGLYVQLMRAHAASGHLAEAVQAYERCRRALVEELGVDPGPAVRAAHERLLKGEALDTRSETRQRRMQGPLKAGAETGADATRTRPRRAGKERLQIPCIGREEELAQLTALLDAALAGEGRMALLHGEPGIGKTRLLEEFEARATARSARVIVARCYEMERDLPYSPLAEALATFLVERVDPGEVPRALGQWGSQLGALIPALRNLVPGLPPHRPLRPDAERAAILAGLTHLLSGLGQRVPLALLVDDLQWADDSTLQWLHYLTRRLPGEPVLVVGTYRTSEVGDDHPLQLLLDSLSRDPAAPRILELACLSLEHVEAILPAVSGSVARGRALAARLHDETDGHPLFLVESLRTLLETGALTLDERGVWGEPEGPGPAPEPAGRERERLPLPPNLQKAILWRVRRLNERQRRLLAAAAVAERGFGPELLGRMTGLARDNTLDGLEALVDRQFLRPGASGTGFDFRHDIVRKAVYAELGIERRRALHARAAETLEALTEGRTETLLEAAGELSHHWLQAGQWEPAFHYTLLAGDRARDAFAPREALIHYQRAAEVSDRHAFLLTEKRRAELLERLGRSHADLGELDRAVRHFEALRELAQSLGDRSLEGRALAALADAHFYRHDFIRAEPLAAEALALSRTLEDQGLLASTLAASANIAMAQGRTSDAERHCEVVLTMSRRSKAAGAGEEQAMEGARLNALGWLGLLRELQGDHDRAMPAIEESLRLGRELRNPFLTGRSRFALGMSLGNRGRYEDALATLKEALRLAEEAGDRYFLPRLLNTVGWIYSELGDLGRAEDWNRRSIAVARETGWLEAEANALVNMGGDAASRGDRRRAREEFERAAKLIGRDSWFTWRYRMRLLVGLGELAFLDGKPERALLFARRALALAEPTGSRKHAGRAWLLSGRALLSAGAPPVEALASFERARSLAIATGYPPLLWVSGAALTRLHTRLGHDAEAAARRREAVQSVETAVGGIRDTGLRASLLNTPAVQAVLAET